MPRNIRDDQLPFEIDAFGIDLVYSIRCMVRLVQTRQEAVARREDTKMLKLTGAARLGAARIFLFAFAAALSPWFAARAQQHESIPARSKGEGPFDRLILRGGYLIDGTGAPAQGPVDIIVENDRIVDVQVVGAPRLAIKEENRPPTDGARELDVSGMYIMPGFVDTHVHLHSMNAGQKVPSEYVLKLWLSHGVTSAREVGNTNEGQEWLVDVAQKLARNEIAGPRLEVYPFFRRQSRSPITSERAARERIRKIKRLGGSGVKFSGSRGASMPVEYYWVALDEANKIGLNSTWHHAQINVMEANVLTSSAHGLQSMEHWYGLPEAMFENKRIQDYPNDYVYENEQDRFGEAGRLWRQAAKPGSEKWNEVMETLLERNFALSPTFTAYLTSRDFMRMSRAVWHDEYTMPNLWDWYRPNRDAHGSYWFYWTIEDELDWKDNYRLWMAFVNEYKNRGGLVGVGSDSGFIYNLYGFGYVQEMELMREAGFSPLEVIHAATLAGARILGIDDEVGSVQVGKKADFVVVNQNPLENLHVLLGTGTIKLNDDTGAVERVGGVLYTIKDGIVYDTRELRKDVREMVKAEKDRRGIPPGPMPIVTVSE